MRKFILLTALILTFGTFAQNEITIKITGQVFNVASDSIYISKYYGNYYADYLRAPLTKEKNSENKTFTITGKLPTADYYVIRIGQQHVNVILRNNSDIKFFADGKSLHQFSNINGSDESVALKDAVSILYNWSSKRDSANVMMQRNPEKAQEINNSLYKEYENFTTLRQQFYNQHPNSAALLPFLSTFNVEQEFPAYEFTVNQLVKGFPESPTIQEVQKNYIQLKAQKDAANIFAPGKPALEFKGLKPDGKELKLSDLKGKVVLIDFWASWCGPCRRENPNVVNLYKQYEKDGFTVLSVSLDQDKTKWVNAIAADGLIWPNHVSDLKGWQSEFAKLYQVTGIPFTLLIDKEGKIINSNLRGEDLHNQLIQLFGH